MNALTWRACGLLLLALLGGCASPGFDMQSHRGGRGLWPENTLVAFENAIRLGTTTIEMDAAVTADGVVVISHDTSLNPALARDASGRWLQPPRTPIRRLTLAQVKAHDVGRLDPEHPYARQWPQQRPQDGQRVPTLAEVFELSRRLGANSLHFDIETKLNPDHPDDTLAPRPFVEALLKVVREHGMEGRVMIQSFDWRTLELLHQLAPGLRTMYLTIESNGFHTLKDGRWTAGHELGRHGGSVPRMVRHSAGTAPGVIWAPFFRNLTPDALAEARRLGLKVIPWTVNQNEDMRRLIQMGVDGLITDYPDRLRQEMAAAGLALPAGKP